MKMIKKIASVACAALMAAQMAAVSVSAVTGYYSSYTGKYYTSYQDALDDSKGIASYITPVYDSSSSTVFYYYSSYTGKYYTTYQAALDASKGYSSYVTPVYNDTTTVKGPVTGYYSSYTGKYYTTYAAAVTASKNISSYVVPVYANQYNPGYTGASIYRYLYNGVYYPTLADAVAAGGTAGVDIYYTYYGDTGSTTYYYYYNGTYYGSLQAAIDAGGTAVGTDISYVPYNYYHNVGTYIPTYVGTSTYPTYVFNRYYDPYFAYRQYTASNSSSSSSSSSSKTVETGTPYIYGNKSKAGWDTLVNIIKNAKSGASYTVDMNGATTVTQSVMQALKGKNVTMTFVLDNGVKWSINGKSITSAKDVVVYTELGIDYIPKKLVAKASKDAISKAQLGISATFDKLGTKANVTVKFNSKRAGCTAVVYRYDPETNALKGVCKAKVQANGSCTITVDQGGPYLIVLK